MKQFFIIYFVILGCLSCNSKQYKAEPEKAAFSLSKNEEKALVALGQLWGFLKYHHPSVAEGNYDWDMELIKLIPSVREAENDSIWKKILDDWLDSLPHVAENPNKKLPDLEIKTKPDYGELFNTEYFLPETVEKIKYILNNAVILSNHYVNVDVNQFGQLSFSNEPSYEEFLYPELSYRLLALFRFWNMVNYFFPYRELCDQNWYEVLVDMLPNFVYAEDQLQYILACTKLFVKIDDSHTLVSTNDIVLLLWLGALTVPFETQFIEENLVVTRYTGNDPYVREKIEIGDIITVIDGVSVDEIVKRMWPYMPASNDAVKRRKLCSYILRGNSNTASITVQREGCFYELKIPRYDPSQLKIPDYSNPYPEKEGYTVLDNNIGYVLPSNCKIEKRKTGTERVLDGTKGVIIDFRCYPNDHSIASSFANHLKSGHKSFFYPNMVSCANVSYPGFFFVQQRNQEIEILYRYTPKIVVLVNQYTQSSAEDNVVSLQQVPNVVVIGSTTAGTNGRVVDIDLPGKISTRMTGMGVYYPDGSDLQRVGIKIDEIVKPTIAGIKAGRDELLERAIEIINESNN